jgi:5-hydroxyisourate hydrolase
MTVVSLTTHVLDLTSGTPAAGIAIELERLDGSAATVTATTNADGRTDAPLVKEGDLRAGAYELRFSVGEHFGGEGIFDVVPIRFLVSDAGAHHHVPLLVTPWAYSTYRGS